MIIKKENIINQLQSKLSYLETNYIGYDKERILGVFLYGSQNYNCDIDNSDIDVRVIILPTFKDFCLQSKRVSTEIICPNEEHIDIKDIRLYREMLLKQNITYVETLFTNYFILNPVYEELFHTYFISAREEIARLNPTQTLSTAYGQALSMLKKINSGTAEPKHIANLLRFDYFINKYKEQAPYQECIWLEDEFANALRGIKNNTLEVDPALFESAIERIKEGAAAIPHYPQNSAAQDLIDKGTMEILKKSFSELQEESSCSKEDFFNKLSSSEEKAYLSIVKQIGNEGNITISKLVKENNISRPVYNNLLAKLKENRVADVVNMGVKGTYLKITNSELRLDAQQKKQ